MVLRGGLGGSEDKRNRFICVLVKSFTWTSANIYFHTHTRISHICLRFALLFVHITADLSQQVVQKVGKIDLGNYRLDTFINNADVSSARKVNRTKTDRLREMEWERDVVTTLNQTQSRRTRDKPLGFRNILTNRLVGEQRCDYCVPSRHLQHYHSWNCTPSFSRECNCAKYYRCSLVKNEVAKVGDCLTAGHSTDH